MASLTKRANEQVVEIKQMLKRKQLRAMARRASGALFIAGRAAT
jgi:hypothetical protein